MKQNKFYNTASPEGSDTLIYGRMAEVYGSLPEPAPKPHWRLFFFYFIFPICNGSFKLPVTAVKGSFIYYLFKESK